MDKGKSRQQGYSDTGSLTEVSICDTTWFQSPRPTNIPKPSNWLYVLILLVQRSIQTLSWEFGCQFACNYLRLVSKCHVAGPSRHALLARLYSGIHTQRRILIARKLETCHLLRHDWPAPVNVTHFYALTTWQWQLAGSSSHSASCSTRFSTLQAHAFNPSSPLLTTERSTILTTFGLR